MRNMKLTKIAYHRNGVGGIGFYAVAFRYREGGKNRCMIATVKGSDVAPGEVHPCTGDLTVLDAVLAAQGIIDYPENRWRGDDFEPLRRQWIAQWSEDETRRLEMATAALEPA